MSVSLKQVAEYVFRKRELYQTLSDDDKDYIFFIFNRCCARLYPLQAEALGKKSIDKKAAMDIWFDFLDGYTSIPPSFWPKNFNKKIKPSIPEKTFERLKEMNNEFRYGLKDNDLQALYLINKEETSHAIRAFVKSQKPDQG